MKILDDIMDAMGIVDEVEEEEAPRKPRTEKASAAETKTNRFMKPAAKEVVEDEVEEEEEELSTREKITSLFKRKSATTEAPAVNKEEEEKSEPARRPLKFKFGKDTDSDEPVEKSAPVAPAAPKPVARHHFPAALGEVNMQMLEPTSFDDSQKVADALHNSQPVVVNFENTDPVVAKRMTDFLSGVIYALQGNMKKIGRNILICAPKNVDIDNGLGEYRGDETWKN